MAKRPEPGGDARQADDRTDEGPWESLVWNRVSDGLVLTCRGVVVAANASAEEMFGYHPSTLVDVSEDTLFPSRFEGRRRDGTLFPMQLSVAPLEPPANGVLAVVRDVTEIVRWKVAAAEADQEPGPESPDAIHADPWHETLSQQLFAVGLGLHLCLRELEHEPTRQQLERAIDVLDQAVDEIASRQTRQRASRP